MVSPLVKGHVMGGSFEQVLVAATQYMPVDAEQSAVPH